MKTISDKPLPNGRRRVVLELGPGEGFLPLRDGAYYRLGQPVDDVVGAHILDAAQPVTWCSVEQKWVE